MAAGIAHDFNNILAIIVMYSDTVRTRLPEEDDANRKKLVEVLTAANRGKDLIAQILDFTRDKAKEQEEFDLTENLRETVQLIGETLAKEVELQVQTPKEPMIVLGDATGLHQVVANLCINAVHAMPEGSGQLEVRLESVEIDGGRAENLRGKLAGSDSNTFFEEQPDLTAKAWLGLMQAGPHARITVTDSGSGMSMETLRRVFDPYFTTKGVGEGTGLGLAAVAGIAAAHNGGIAVESLQGHGTTFHIFLPLPGNDQETKTNG